MFPNATHKSEAYSANPMSPAAIAQPTAIRPPDTPVGAILILWLVPTDTDVVLWPVFVGATVLPPLVADVEFVLAVVTGALVVAGTLLVHGVVGVAPCCPSRQLL
jgi:hypothetical protein